MDLLHEWRLCVHETLVIQDPMDLLDTPVRVYYMLKHRLNDHCVKRSILKWDIMCVAHEHGAWSKRDITLDQLQRPRPGQTLHALSQDAAADYQDSWSIWSLEE
jgi:hypothetical protein